MKRTTALLALLLSASGCSYMDYRSGGVEPLRNAQGHVIGHKETLRSNGEVLARISLYVPRYDNGKIVGYEERVRGGAVLRSLEGKRIGNRFVDLRSQGTNPGNRGLTIIVYSKPAERFAAPDIEELRTLAKLDQLLL